MLLADEPLLRGPRDVISGDDDVESFDDFDFEEDFEAVRLHVYKNQNSFSKVLISIF